MAHRKLTQSLSANAAALVAVGIAVGCSSASEPSTQIFMVEKCNSRKRSSQNQHAHDGVLVHQLTHRALNGSKAVKTTTTDFQLGRQVGHQVHQQFSIGLSSLSLRALCEGAKTTSDTEPQRFERILAYHCSQISTYRQKWEYASDSNATTSTKTPSRSWPDNVPSNEELSSLLEDLKYCTRSPNFRGDKDYCSKIKFRIASALLIQFDGDNQQKGFEILRTLAEGGYPDAMVYYGMCLNEGRVAGTEPDSITAVSWFKRCVDMFQHPQALYELGVAYYTGEGVAEDEEEAVRLFQLAGEQDHPAACYMLGDCLLDGLGADIDRGPALEWLVRASELGHRGARSRVMAVLVKKEGEDYGAFTDASRQTMVEHVPMRSANEQGALGRRRPTLRKDGVLGGSRNQTELVRRQTIVGNSRK